MYRNPRTHSRSRPSHSAADPEATLRDRMLVALTNKSVILQVVESTEWQRPLTLQDGAVVGFVDLWVTLRVTSYRVSQGNDPTDPEQRVRYEGYSVHHLIRSVALFVEPTVPSLSGLVRQVRYAQAYAKNALPVLVTCRPTAPVLAQQGIPT